MKRIARAGTGAEVENPARPSRRCLLVRGPAALLACAAATWFSLASGCASSFVATRPHPAPDPAAVLAFLRQRQAAIRGVDLETRTTSWLGGQRTRATVFMLVDRTGRLRFEAEIALQGTVATLITDGKNFSLADFQANQAKRGLACPENVASLIPVPLRPDEIAPILLGDVPLGPEARVVGVTWDGKAAADVVEIENRTAGVVSTRLWVSVRPDKQPGRFEILAVEGVGPDPRAGRWRVAFDEREGEGGQRQPGLIRFAEPGRSFDDGVEIKVKSRKLNPSFRPQAFTPEPPAGMPVETVVCRPRP